MYNGASDFSSVHRKAFLMTAIRIFVCLIMAAGIAEAKDRLGIKGQAAPAWDAGHWRNMPDHVRGLNVADYEGKVLYLYFFQSWCPGCHSHGFPTLAALTESYKDDEKVAFVAIQTVFEGFSSNTPKRALESIERHGLTIPVGHSGGKNKRSNIMADYRTGGTPWTVIIDPKGIVRFNGFHISPDQARGIIDSLR